MTVILREKMLKWIAFGAASSLSTVSCAATCTNIESLPATINASGVYCLGQDLNTAQATGSAITINASNVTLDMNGFKLGGLAAGQDTRATGVYAVDRQNVTVRNGTIRGFYRGVHLDVNGQGSKSAGHLVEDLRIEGARFAGIQVEGDYSIIRSNHVLESGGGIGFSTAYGILVSSGGGHSITENTVSGVTAVSIAYGIGVVFAPGVIIQQNNIHDVKALTQISTAEAITAISNDGTVVNGNQITRKQSGPGTGIRLAGANTICRDNVISGYETAPRGCIINVGNSVTP